MNRVLPNLVTEVGSWAHADHEFLDTLETNPSPIAAEAVVRIGELFAIERDIRGASPDLRWPVRQEPARRRLEPLLPPLEAQMRMVSSDSALVSACRCPPNDGRRCSDTVTTCCSKSATTSSKMPRAVSSSGSETGCSSAHLNIVDISMMGIETLCPPSTSRRPIGSLCEQRKLVVAVVNAGTWAANCQPLSGGCNGSFPTPRVWTPPFRNHPRSCRRLQ